MPHSPTHRDCQVFFFAAYRWCITHALELITADPEAATLIEEAEITGLGQFLPIEPDEPGSVALIRVEVDTEYAMSTDLTKPLLVAPLEAGGQPAGAVVIDGWHRVYRALREGRTHLPALLLTTEAERTCRVLW